MTELKTGVINITVAVILGVGSSLIATFSTLTRFETKQEEGFRRIVELESDQARVEQVANATSGELRVINEKLKRIEDLSDSLRRIERKLDKE